MNNYSDEKHFPVLYNEVIDFSDLKKENMRIIDGTLGYGGHSERFLKLNESCEVLGIDRDIEALAFAKNRLSFAKERFISKQGSFSEMNKIAIRAGWDKVDLVLLDLGISSPQIDNPARGFAHRMNGPLDMRMDQSSEKTASRVLNSASFNELSDMFKKYGEIRSSKKLAAAIIEYREKNMISTTEELKTICEDLFGVARPGKLPTATLCFQALRIEVNDELQEVEKGIKIALDMLKEGGKLIVISFHSLEDRIAKQFFKKEAISCVCPPGMPICICGHKKLLKILTKKPITASKEELKVNRRATCAKMRVVQKL